MVDLYFRLHTLPRSRRSDDAPVTKRQVQTLGAAFVTVLVQFLAVTVVRDLMINSGRNA